jgi:predicted acyltransferase
MVKVLKRAAILFALGLILHGFPNYDFTTIRIPGVLQRIALAYAAGSAIVLYLSVRGQVAMTAGLLLGYWALQTLVPVPGLGAGALEPGRDLGAWIDRLVFGEAHLWIWSKTWDPEGLLSTIPAVASVLTGVFAGYWLRSDRSAAEKTVGLFVAGNALLLLGWAWSAWFPINKNLWTSSYVAFTSGMACHFLAMCYWLVDVRGHRRWAKPFVFYGLNAIAAIFLSSLMARTLSRVRVPSGDAQVPLQAWIFDHAFAPFASPLNASLAYALAYVLFWLAVMWVMYRKRIFIKV